MDWCGDSASYRIKEVGSDKVLYDYNGSVVSAYATATYSGIFADMPANAPVWSATIPANFGGNLVYEETSGWFYWQNDGADLQVDKSVEFKLSQNFPKLAKLAVKGTVTVLSTAHSDTAHLDHAPATVTPGANAHATYEVIFE